MNKIEFGDCRDIMRRWYDDGVKVQMCVTSPPYFGLRDYGVEGQFGAEKTPEEYVCAMVETFREVRNLLNEDGVLWLNLGDSYNAAGRKGHGTRQGYKQATNRASSNGLDTGRPSVEWLKEKDLIGIPWMVAFALRADGWYLRQDIIWVKPNPMPESVRDRCTKSHEYLFLLSKSPKYYFNAEAIKEPLAITNAQRTTKTYNTAKKYGAGNGGNSGLDSLASAMRRGEHTTRNKRDVWTITSKPFKGAHFATFPPDLIEPCILAGSRPEDIVLDPFMGSGTVAGVAIKHGRRYLGCDLNPQYGDLHEARIKSIAGEKA